MSNVPHNNLPEAQTAGGAVANPDDDNPYAAYGEQATGGARNIIKFRKGRFFVSVRPARPSNRSSDLRFCPW